MQNNQMDVECSPHIVSHFVQVVSDKTLQMWNTQTHRMPDWQDDNVSNFFLLSQSKED